MSTIPHKRTKRTSLLFQTRENNKTSHRINFFYSRVITENNLHDDNRPYHYEQNLQEQQHTFINNNDD